MLIEIGCIAIFLIEIKDPCCSLIFSEQRFDDVRYDNFYVGIIVSPISSFSSIVGEYTLIIADTFIYINRIHSHQKEREYITIPCHTYTSSPLEIKYSYKVLFTDYPIFVCGISLGTENLSKGLLLIISFPFVLYSLIASLKICRILPKYKDCALG